MEGPGAPDIAVGYPLPTRLTRWSRGRVPGAECLVWVLDAGTRVLIRRADGTQQTLLEPIRSLARVLPDFALPLRELFR
jgi:hypothetical protein